MAEQKESFRFHDITVDPYEFRVTRGDDPIVLTPRAFDVLLVLLRNSGRILEKQEIFEAVWKDTFVTDNALVKVIRELRNALGDDAENPHLIQTVPKRGYRFIGEVTGEESAESGTVSESTADAADQTHDPAPASQTASVKQESTGKFAVIAIAAVLLVAGIGGWLLYRQTNGGSAQSIRSIAVLPFKPLSPESRDESLEMGMAETLINRLSSVRQLAVRPITSVRKFTDASQDPVQAGQETKAEAVLDGSIQKSGDRIRITVRLIEVSTGNALWSEKFDENFTDIFRVQDSIAERVTNALLIQLNGQEKSQLVRHETSSPEAYQEYLRCQLIWHGRRADWIMQSRKCYEDVIAKDPNFALAYVGAAEAYISLSGHLMLPKKDAANMARPLIAKALEIDPSLALAYNAQAELAYQFDFDWNGAETGFKKALELNPNAPWIHQAYGWFLMTEGRFDEAAVEMDRAKELDPSSVTIEVGRGRLYYFSRDFEKARVHFEKLIELQPDDTSLQYSLFTILEQQKKYSEAVELVLKMHLRYGGSPERADELREAFTQGGWQGFLEKQLEMQSKRPPGAGPGSPWFYANHYTRMGRKDEAFMWLERSFDAGEMGNLQLKIDPLYDVLRDDPRYAQLLARIGLQP